ncbi:MAG: hypothetical protein DMD83_24830 [Candidatus Rokuibacteriota bacterium]|nr:MAG: hypothetical protein DMD83_24830 [Candidatus Rokubacteria bacterium]
MIEFDSMINVRPSQGNRSRSVEDLPYSDVPHFPSTSLHARGPNPSRTPGTGRPVARLAEPEQEHRAPSAAYGPRLGTFGSGPRSPRSPRVVSGKRPGEDHRVPRPRAPQRPRSSSRTMDLIWPR